MRDKLHDYLIQRPAGATIDELVELVFHSSGRDPGVAGRVVSDLLADDPRFAWRPEEQSWHATVHAALARPLADTTFTVVDLEMTGMEPSRTRIIEVGAVRVHGGRVAAEFQQLVNPGVSLPPFIVGLTGIQDVMLADQPDIAAVWPDLQAFIGDSVLVAHNAPFDIGVLNSTAMRLTGRELANQHLCTLRLARILLPELAKRGLEALTAHFGIPHADRHRALGDARVTVEVLFHLLEMLAAREVHRLDQTLEFQNRARDGRPFVSRLPRDKVRGLPEVPGIYHLLDEEGRVLYVGKAKNLRVRVSSYLSNTAGHGDKVIDLIRAARDVRVETLGSELEAALAEAAAIRSLRPRYNRLDRHFPRIAFLKLNLGDAYPRLSVSKRLGRGTAHFIGPFRSAKDAERVLGVLAREFRLRTCSGPLQPSPECKPCAEYERGRCTAPCAAQVSVAEYRGQIDALLESLRGREPAVEALLERRVREREARGGFEGAAYTKREIDALRLLVRTQRDLGWILELGRWVVFEPAVDRRMVLAYGICDGRLVAHVRMHDPAELDAFAVALRTALATPATSPNTGDVEGSTILAAWMREPERHGGSVLAIEDPDVSAPTLEAWRAVFEEVLARSGGDGMSR